MIDDFLVLRIHSLNDVSLTKRVYHVCIAFGLRLLLKTGFNSIQPLCELRKYIFVNILIGVQEENLIKFIVVLNVYDSKMIIATHVVPFLLT